MKRRKQRYQWSKKKVTIGAKKRKIKLKVMKKNSTTRNLRILKNNSTRKNDFSHP
jgi:hypothetical protein